MDIQTKEQLARRGEVSPDAICRRLVAARESVGMRAEQLARDMGEGMTKQKVVNAEKGRNNPSIEMMRYFFRAHRIDFTFILHGDFSQLPSDVQDRLFAALAALGSAPDQTEGSDQRQGEPPVLQEQEKH